MTNTIIVDRALKAFMSSHLVGEFKQLSFSYDIRNQRKSMAIALTFWKYLRKLYPHDVQKKRGSIFSLMKKEKEFMASPLIKIVAMIEVLPDRVWRQLLWKENIDFVSFESFLRRLSSRQTDAIVDNYAHLFGHWDVEDFSHSPKLPPVLKKGFRNRLKVFFGRVTVKKLLEEECDANTRYQSKGAWAFNLLGLDFGFSLYPKGENNDAKITNQSFTRFLSVKEHINDFIVNQEDGKYWWLYKSARSNYAFNPNREVQLKSHICPGFWATFLSHLVFWVVSPIGFIITLIWAASTGGYASLLPLILSLPMILWLVVAFVRLLAKGIERMPKKLQIIPKAIGVAALTAFLLMVAGAILFAIGGAIYFLAPIVGSILSVMLVLTICFYIGFYFIVIAGSSSFSYSDLPKLIRLGLHFTLIATALVLFDKYVAAALIALIVQIAQSIWAWYTSDLLINNWFILMLLFTAAFTFFYSMFIKDEERFVRHQRLFFWMIKGFMAVTIIVFGVFFLKSGAFALLTDSLLPGASLAAFLLLLGIALMMKEEANLNNISERSRIADLVFRANSDLGGFSSKSYISRILKSKWLWQLEEDQRWATADRIIELSFELFDNYPEERLDFINHMVTRGSYDLTLTLRESSQDIRYFADKKSETWTIIRMMTDGYSLNEAMNTVHKQRTAWEKSKQGTKKVLKAIAWPFVMIWRFLAWSWSGIRQFFWTLKDIWSLFNERCPYVSRPKTLT